MAASVASTQSIRERFGWKENLLDELRAQFQTIVVSHDSTCSELPESGPRASLIPSVAARTAPETARPGGKLPMVATSSTLRTTHPARPRKMLMKDPTATKVVKKEPPKMDRVSSAREMSRLKAERIVEERRKQRTGQRMRVADGAKTPKAKKSNSTMLPAPPRSKTPTTKKSVAKSADAFMSFDVDAKSLGEILRGPDNPATPRRILLGEPSRYSCGGGPLRVRVFPKCERGSLGHTSGGAALHTICGPPSSSFPSASSSSRTPLSKTLPGTVSRPISAPQSSAKTGATSAPRPSSASTASAVEGSVDRFAVDFRLSFYVPHEANMTAIPVDRDQKTAKSKLSTDSLACIRRRRAAEGDCRELMEIEERMLEEREKRLIAQIEAMETLKSDDLTGEFGLFVREKRDALQFCTIEKRPRKPVRRASIVGGGVSADCKSGDGDEAVSREEEEDEDETSTDVEAAMKKRRALSRNPLLKVLSTEDVQCWSSSADSAMAVVGEAARGGNGSVVSAFRRLRPDQ